MTQYIGAIHEDETCFYFHGWVSFHPDNGMKLTAREPQGIAGSRHMKLVIQIPKAVFSLPELSCHVRVNEPQQNDKLQVSTRVAAEALEKVLGAKVRVVVGDE